MDAYPIEWLDGGLLFVYITGCYKDVGGEQF